MSALWQHCLEFVKGGEATISPSARLSPLVRPHLLALTVLPPSLGHLSPSGLFLRSLCLRTCGAQQTYVYLAESRFPPGSCQSPGMTLQEQPRLQPLQGQICKRRQYGRTSLLPGWCHWTSLLRSAWAPCVSVPVHMAQHHPLLKSFS